MRALSVELDAHGGMITHPGCRLLVAGGRKSHLVTESISQSPPLSYVR